MVAEAVSVGQTYDGNPLFFPVGHHQKGERRYRANVAPDHGYGWVYEDEIIPRAARHNFYFTTEVTYWFQYDASSSATLDFNGVDDVWFFVNGKLAVDVGGLHAPMHGSVTINADSAARFTWTTARCTRSKPFTRSATRKGGRRQVKFTVFCLLDQAGDVVERGKIETQVPELTALVQRLSKDQELLVGQEVGKLSYLVHDTITAAGVRILSFWPGGSMTSRTPTCGEVRALFMPPVSEKNLPSALVGRFETEPVAKTVRPAR